MGGNIYCNFNICDILGKRNSRSFLIHRFIQEGSRMQLLTVPQQCHCQYLCWWRNTQISRDWLHIYSSSNRTFLITGNISSRVFSISNLYSSPIILTLENRDIVLLMNKQIYVALGAKKKNMHFKILILCLLSRKNDNMIERPELLTGHLKGKVELSTFQSASVWGVKELVPCAN